MKKIILLVILIFTCSYNAWADIDCGSTLSTAGTYVLEANKACDGTWITVTVGGVVVNMDGYTVSYANVTASNGVVIGGTPSAVQEQSFEIYGGTLNEGSGDGTRTNGIYATSRRVDGLKIHGLEINTVGSASNAIQISDVPAGTYDIAIYENEINVIPVSVTANSYYPNGIWFNTSGSVVGIGEGIHHNTIVMGPNTGNGTRPRPITGVDGSASYRFPIHHNTITMNGPIQQGIAHYGAIYVAIYSNDITVADTADNVRGILIDGGSSYFDVYDNTITLSPNNVTSGSRAIQVRYASNNNYIHDNTIDVSGATGQQGIGISLGADQSPTSPSGPADSNDVYNNTIVSGGSNSCFNLSSGLSNTNIYCNRCTHATGDGQGVTSTLTDASTTISGINMDYNTFTMGGSGRFYLRSGITFSDIEFCGNIVNGIAAQLTDFTGDTTGITISNSGCAKTCSILSKLSGGGRITGGTIR